MHWIILSVTTMIFCGYTYATYSSVKDSNYYVYLAVGYGILNQFLWAMAAKSIKEKDFLYFYGNLWDFVTTAI